MATRIKNAIIITVANFKGGVGKTTTVLNLAFAFVAKGLKVLIIDHDSQGNATMGLGVKVSSELRTIKEALEDMQGLPCYQINERLSLVPSDIRLSTIEKDLHKVKGRYGRLRTLIDEIRNQFDIILIDCPPNHGMETNGPLLAAQWVIVPFETTLFSIRGLRDMYNTMDEARLRNPSLAVLGLLPVRHKNTKDHEFVLAETREMYPEDLLTSYIRESTTVSATQLARKNIFEYLPKSYGAKDYGSLAEEVLQKLNITIENGK